MLMLTFTKGSEFTGSHLIFSAALGNLQISPLGFGTYRIRIGEDESQDQIDALYGTFFLSSILSSRLG